MTSLGGPVTQATIAPNEGVRFGFSGAPVDYDPDFVVIKDHFTCFDSEATHGNWLVVKDSGAAVAVSDAHGGVLTLTSAATTENDGATVASVKEIVKLTSATKVWFEARVKWANVGQLDSIVGFTTRPGTFDDPEDVLSENDIFGFVVADGSASLNVQNKVGGSGSAVAPTNAVTLVDDTWVRLGIYWDGTRGWMLKDRVVVHTFTSAPTTEMQIVLFSLSGVNTGTQVMSVDSVYFATNIV